MAVKIPDPARLAPVARGSSSAVVLVLVVAGVIALIGEPGRLEAGFAADGRGGWIGFCAGARRPTCRPPLSLCRRCSYPFPPYLAARYNAVPV